MTIRDLLDRLGTVHPVAAVDAILRSGERSCGCAGPAAVMVGEVALCLDCSRAYASALDGGTACGTCGRFAEIQLESKGERILVDARPSDSIAIALRTDASIFVEEEIFASGSAGMGKHKSEKENAAELRKLLESMDPGDFGRFGV